MKPIVSILMGSISDFEIMQNAAKVLDEFEVPFEIKILSAHRTPLLAQEYATNAYERGIRVIIAGAGGAAHLPGVIASYTHLPVIGVPCRSSISIDGWDSILSILQMPAGIPVATVALDNAQNAALLAIQILATSDEKLKEKLIEYKKNLANKVIKANEELKNKEFKFKVSN
ncbi:MAG: 5-(carboxyamino)imidazole ribonucleotide mutase [Bacteroidales bacterium]|nr:5-(carboxyamino)imidazole ribonucleotide mutase [Bacteroidales bacterium]